MGVGLVGTAAVVAGCTPKGLDRRPRPGATVSPAAVDPDVALAATVLAEEQALLDRVIATVERHPDLETTLSLARSAHQAHVDLLKDAVPDDVRIPASSPSPSTSPSTSASPSVAPPSSPPSVPTRVPVALRAVVAAEDRLALVGRRSSFAAQSMAAAAAQQAAALAVAARAPR